MPKIVDHAARRRHIATKAVAVLVRDGIQDAHLGKVADECGLARTTLYQSFKNLDELIDFILAETFDLLEAKALVQDPSLDPVERIRQFLHLQARVAIEEKEKMVLVLDLLLHPHRQAAGRKFDAPERVRTLRAELAGLLEQAVAAGEFKPLDARSMAFTLFTFVEAATVHAVYYDNSRLDDTVRDIDLLIEGLRAPKD
jgi:AcrR family transcriptional regulator